MALKNLDEVIDMIRKSPDAETARTRLMKRFKLSEIQAQAILDMPLRRLAALERKKIEEEYKELQAQIKEPGNPAALAQEDAPGGRRRVGSH